MIDMEKIQSSRFGTYGLCIITLITGLLLRTVVDHIYYPNAHTATPLEVTAKAADSDLAQLIHAAYVRGEKSLSNHETEKATAAFRTALTAHPDMVQSMIRMGSALFQAERFESAEAYFRAALLLEPNTIGTYMRLGLTLHRLKKYDKAISAFSVVIKNVPNYAEAYIQLTRVCMDANKLDNAIAYGKKGIEHAPQDIHAYLNTGHVFNKIGDTENAKKMYRKALEINNDFPNANYNLGYTLRLEGNLKESIPYLEKALRLQSHYPDAHVALAQAYWSLNQFKPAWEHYYYRWQLHGVDPQKLQAPLWDGSDLQGKTILLYAEQGLGDTLQFIRFAKEAKQRGARVICKVQGPVAQLLSTYPYIDKIISKQLTQEHIDYQIALMSMPGIIGMTPSTIPADVPYLKADKKLVQQWKQKLSHDKNFKIGICWDVDPQHELTKSPLSTRSVPLHAFADLATIPDVSFYSLQKTHNIDDFKNKPAHFTVHTFNPDFDETNGRFMDTAAVIENLDLIVSVDTSVVHVAGALGKPVWVILPQSPDCRWYFTGDKTAWYPTMRLFRQAGIGDFETPIKQIKVALQKEIQKKKLQ